MTVLSERTGRQENINVQRAERSIYLNIKEKKMSFGLQCFRNVSFVRAYIVFQFWFVSKVTAERLTRKGKNNLQCDVYPVNFRCKSTASNLCWDFFKPLV